MQTKKNCEVETTANYSLLSDAITAGTCTVDTASLWIGDPYLFIGNKYFQDEHPKFGFDLGTYISSGYGDGRYRINVGYDKNKIKAVYINFFNIRGSNINDHIKNAEEELINCDLRESIALEPWIDSEPTKGISFIISAIKKRFKKTRDGIKDYIKNAPKDGDKFTIDCPIKSGFLWIGDLCYIRDYKPTNAEPCSKITTSEIKMRLERGIPNRSDYFLFDHPNNISGLGICFKSGYGPGHCPIEMTYYGGRVQNMMIFLSKTKPYLINNEGE